ncbi:MAG: chromosomal replication initiator protein DnaA [Parvibaculaceae bacterium]
MTREELDRRWERIARRLRAELGEELYVSWFQRMEAEHYEDRRLCVSVPTRFLKSWIDSHYSDRLVGACNVEFGELDAVVTKVRARGLPVRPPSIQAEIETPAAADPAREARRFPSRSIESGPDRGSPLDHGLTFETFVIGRSNALAHAAAVRVADATPGQPLSFNPLYIHSPAGLGKTHLLNAMSWRIRQRFQDRRVLFITAEKFMVQFSAALKARDTLAFKDYFQSIDVLLIDDFQFLQGKTMQQEFCHTFNSLVDAKRQVIVAADVPPAQLESIDQRMRSRLAGGLVVDIELPDLELRRSILQARLQGARHRSPGLHVPEDVVEFIANRITGGGRELEGALNRVIALQQLRQGAPMTVDLAAQALRDLTQTAEAVRVRIDDILQAIGRHYNVSRADLLSPRRARAIVRPRQVGMYLAKKLTSRSLPEIGRRFGGRDHSTVLHAVRKVEELMQADDKMAREVALLTRIIEHP